MKRTEKVEATLTPTEKKIFRALCEEAGCTEAELIRSVLIHREISLEDLDDDMQVSDRKKKALHRQQSDFRKAQNTREVDECGEPLAEKRNSYLRVMLTAPEKKAIEQRAEALGISVSETVQAGTKAIDEVAKKSAKSIEKLEQAANARAKRFMRITKPEVMVNIAIWIAVAVASAIILSFCYEFFTK